MQKYGKVFEGEVDVLREMWCMLVKDGARHCCKDTKDAPDAHPQIQMAF